MRLLIAAVMFLAPAAAPAAEPFALKPGQRVVFLGDSNTFAGKFIAYLDAYLCTRFPDKRFELINLGLPSETVSGLSEPDHPYPRPNVHDRVDRALELTKPDVVVICYGMNDGIYSPFAGERFKKYQEGMLKLIEKVEKAGATAMLMTPAPFDATALKDKVQPKGAEKYSWLRPYEKYDEEVLTKYSEWLLTLRAKKYTVIDAHAALLRHLGAMRKEDGAYRVSGDGIHPNANGHMVIALEILKEWKAPTAVKDIVIDVKRDPPSESDLKAITARRNGATFTFDLPHPMPGDPQWTARAKEVEKFDEKVNRYPLKVEGLGGFLAIAVGEPGKKGVTRRVPTRADEISKGLDMAEALKAVPDPKAGEIWKLIDEKNRILGLAWLTHVGHKRPDTPKGLPIEEAKKKAAALDEAIRKLCEPTEVRMSVGPLGK
jgi:lysophospholipase L1-like esterase